MPEVRRFPDESDAPARSVLCFSTRRRAASNTLIATRAPSLRRMQKLVDILAENAYGYRNSIDLVSFANAVSCLLVRPFRFRYVDILIGHYATDV